MCKSREATGEEEPLCLTETKHVLVQHSDSVRG